MISPPIPAEERKRLHELYSTELLDSPYEKEFDDIVHMASKICNTPISLISLIDTDRQWFKAKVGLDSPETHRNISFCGYSILGNDLMEINNALADNRFYDNPLVTSGPNIRFYAGMPLIGKQGYKLGTICVIDVVPRYLDKEQSNSLAALSRQIMTIVELRMKIKELNDLTSIKNRIISIIGHDVRNPLASLKSVLDLKETGDIEGEEEDLIFKMASDQLDHTIELVTNLAEWGTLNINYNNTSLNRLMLNSLTESCVKVIAINAVLKNNIIQNETDDIVYANIDKNSLLFILRNLITNANKFTEGGVITITNKQENGRLVISVTDTGIGMDEYKVNGLLSNAGINTTAGTQKESGTGLGILLIDDFLKRVNGRLAINSTPGKGTCVSVVLE